jgi:hypothetical protein
MEMFFSFISKYATLLNRALKKLITQFYSDESILTDNAKIIDFISKIVIAVTEFVQTPSNVEARRVNLLLALLNSHVNGVYVESRLGIVMS